MAEGILARLEALGAESLVWLRRRASAGFVRRVQTEWARAGRVIHWGPENAVCTLALPDWRGGAVPGALGLVDGGLLFAGQQSAVCDVHLPFEAIVWVGLRRGRGLPGGGRRLAVHAERAGLWLVHVYALDRVVPLAEALAARVGKPLEYAASGREDFGPERAWRLGEDVYGEWHANREDDLYLAPDRLLFGWREAILLETIEQVDVLERPPGGRGRGPLLRIAYRVDADTYEVVGFAPGNATAWAEAIAARAGGELAIGRKRKDV